MKGTWCENQGRGTVRLVLDAKANEVEKMEKWRTWEMERIEVKVVERRMMKGRTWEV